MSHAALERMKSIKADDEKCDNLLLEWTLALALHKLDRLGFVYPIFCGDYRETDEGPLELGKYDFGIAEQLPDVAPAAVHAEVLQHLVSSHGLSEAEAKAMLKGLTVKVRCLSLCTASVICPAFFYRLLFLSFL